MAFDLLIAFISNQTILASNNYLTTFNDLFNDGEA